MWTGKKIAISPAQAKWITRQYCRAFCETARAEFPEQKPKTSP